MRQATAGRSRTNRSSARGARRLRAAAPGLCLLAVLLSCSGPATDRTETGTREPRQTPGGKGPPPPGLEYVPPSPGTYSLPAIQDAVDGEVLDADGTNRRLFDYLGDKHALLSFVYTRCTDSKGCPLATAVLNLVDEELKSEPDVAGKVRLISLSFDPSRDTPEVMKSYAPKDYTDTGWKERPWVFLTTASKTDLQPILDGYGQYIVEEVDESGRATGDLSHVLKVYLIDRERKVRNIYSTKFIHPAIAVNDLKTLLLEDEGRS